MIPKILRNALVLLLLLIGNAERGFASHIVGAEITYVCLGPSGPNAYNYQIRLDLYQDCQTGSPAAIAEDNPAYLRIFETGSLAILFDSIAITSSLIIPAAFSNSCLNNVPTTCLRRATFIRNFVLPVNTQGYQIVYQRCCRNASVVNIFNPGNVGATYFCIIPPPSTGASCNNSAVFKNYPPQIICVNNPLVYDHSATDVDGDSLSYEFCDAYLGGSTNDAKPIPDPPPYSTVNYLGSYSAAKPMAGFPLVQINPTTGQITGTPNILGRFVVTVCCHEWRNGVIINTVKREFQFVVTNCSKKVVANIPQYSNEPNTYIVECYQYNVLFNNLSTGGNSYFWDFGVPGTTSDTSDAFEPQFTYPDTGVYIVKLVVNKGTTCTDSITRFVKIFPTFQAGIADRGVYCPNSPIQFLDSSVTTFPPVNSWQWNFGDGGVSVDQNPFHVFDTGGAYTVSLISTNTKGCADTADKVINVDFFTPFAGNDTFIVVGERINFNASGGDFYQWSPSTYLDNPNINNPQGYYPVTDTISYVVSIATNAGCTDVDTINVYVVAQGSIFVPSAFSPNDDGVNDFLLPIGIGYSDIGYFRIFNRFGEQVFYTSKFGEGWDGKLKGSPCDIGAYFWVLEVTDRFGKITILKGDATLVR